MQTESKWIQSAARWAESQPAISKAWLFGSRAKCEACENSDLDIAILLEPSDGDALAEWIMNAAKWKVALQAAVGDFPKVDLQVALPEGDEIVWPAVSNHGIILFERDTEES